MLKNHTYPLALLLASPVILLPLNRYEIGTAFLLLLSFYLLISPKRLAFKNNTYKSWLILFSCVWIPSLASLSEAINFSHSATNTFGQLRYLLAGFAIIYLVSQPNIKQLFFNILGVALVFVFIDNVVQMLTGNDLFGLPTYKGRLNAPWTSDGPKMGIFIALIGPIIVGYFFDTKPKLAWVLTGMVVFLVLMSGQRGAWLALLTSIFIFAISFGRNLKEHIPTISKVLASLIFLSFIAYNSFTPFQIRADKTLQALNFDSTSIQESTGRLDIWKGAVDVIKENPINGVGIRGFRYTESTGNISRLHVHSTTLEILTEAGIIGFIGYIFFFWLIYTKVFKPVSQLTHLQRFTLGSVVAAASPLSMSLAFYSSNKATVFWYITALLVSFFFVKASDKDLELKKSS
jgi:O-antigen ligase